MTRQIITSAYVADAANATNNTVEASPFTGSTDTAILEFAVPAIPVGLIAEATSPAGGTFVQIRAAGIYHVSFAMVFAGDRKSVV